MVYNWDDKEAECYRLYVQEKRSLDEVIAYWEAQGFTPRYVIAQLNVPTAVHFLRLSQASTWCRRHADDDLQANEPFKRSSGYVRLYILPHTY